jgi:hypothetical protein
MKITVITSGGEVVGSIDGVEKFDLTRDIPRSALLDELLTLIRRAKELDALGEADEHKAVQYVADLVRRHDLVEAEHVEDAPAMIVGWLKHNLRNTLPTPSIKAISRAISALALNVE